MDDELDALEPAEQRTSLAEDRTMLANERTFASWMRTSLGSLAIALGFHALFQRIEPGWVPRGIATAFAAIAIVTIILAERRAAAVHDRLDSHVVITARGLNLRLLTATVTLAALALIAAFWLLQAD